MIKLLVLLMLEFPQLADAVSKLRDAYTKAYKANRHRRMRQRIDDWLRDLKSK